MLSIYTSCAVLCTLTPLPVLCLICLAVIIAVDMVCARLVSDNQIQYILHDAPMGRRRLRGRVRTPATNDNMS